MLVEHRDDNTLVYGYLDTDAGYRTRAFDTVVVRSGGSLWQAETRPYRLGTLAACEIAGDEATQVRPYRPPGAPGPELCVGLLLSGHGRLGQDGRLATLEPGEFALYSGTRPFRLEFDGPYRYFLLILDAGRLWPASRATANRDILGLPSARILAAMLQETAHQAPGLGPVTGCEVGHHLVGMLRTVLRESAPPASRAPLGDGSALLERILEHIELNLADDLPPASIAAAHHISVRYLHQLFHRQGHSVGDYVRRRRLERIRQELTDPDLAHLPGHALASRWGIKDPSHFSKLFRAEFGLSPRELRAQAAQPG
jgi:AraC-like DNA-binding protein